MRKISLFKKLALFGGLFVAGAAMLVSLGTSSTAEAASCTTGSKYTDFTGYVTGKDTLTIRTKDNLKLCNDVDVHFASFVIHNDYNGEGFSKNPTALPQTQYYIKTVTLKKGTTGDKTVTVDIPDECTNYQIDAYIGKIQTEIKTSEGFIGTNAITSKLYQKTKDDCSEPKQIKACNMNTHDYEMVDEGKENTPPYTMNFDYCETTTVCDTKTGDIIEDITKEEAKDPRYADVNDEACNPPEQVTVCDTSTTPGTVVTINKDVADADEDRYVDANDEACNPPEETTEIPSTGPAEIISGILGTGSLAGAGSMYIKSRRSLFRFFK